LLGSSFGVSCRLGWCQGRRQKPIRSECVEESEKFRLKPPRYLSERSTEVGVCRGRWGKIGVNLEPAESCISSRVASRTSDGNSLRGALKRSVKPLTRCSYLAFSFHQRQHCRRFLIFFCRRLASWVARGGVRVGVALGRKGKKDGAMLALTLRWPERCARSALLQRHHEGVLISA
jgi:hypothetical protein